MRIKFLGADQTVTGSKHLIQVGNYNLLLDCGLHQGRRKESNQLNKNFPFEAKKINAVILSHAHLDHCGMLPILVNEGFEGKIYCTAATRDIAAFILNDSAMIQEQDCEYYNNHLPPGETLIEPIYTERDVKKTLGHFEAVPYFRLSNQWTQLNQNIRFKFYDAGHILGSAVTLLEIKEPFNSVQGREGKIKRLVFTGDLGRDFLPILRSPEYVEEPAETLITECTYGSRIHRAITNLESDLKNIVNEAAGKKSKIIVPAFSLGRTQELIYILHKLVDQKDIPALPIFIDSPLAQKITRVFQTYTSDFDEEFWTDFGEKGKKAFLFDNLITTSSIQESKSINDKPGPMIIIAGSGMAEGGRILHHLKNNIENPNSIILITGYQAKNTLGRKILEGVSPVKIYGKDYQVKTKVIVLNELSAHADQKDLLDYVGHINGLKNIFLVHAENKEASAFKEIAEKEYPLLSIHIPSFKEEFEV